MAGKIRIDIAPGLSLDAQKIVTGRSCVIAQSGAGKSYLLAVLCEKMLEKGIAFCIVDTEGEYSSLKEKFEILWAGGEESDIDIEKTDMARLARKVVEENMPMILDVSDAMDERKIVSGFCKSLYNVETRLKKPYLLILEEADKFIPQGKLSSKEIEEIARRGRKRGLGLLVATQRPALTSKNVLSQCSNQFIGKLTTENDLSAVNLFFSSRRELEELPRLKQGEFFVMGNISAKKMKIRSHPRITRHKGSTPTLVSKAVGKISEIKEKLTSVEPAELPDEIPAGQKRVMAVEPRIERKKVAEIIEKKRKKKFLVFGEKERVTSFDLFFHPLAYVEVKYPSKLMRKLKTLSFIVDTVTSSIVDIKNGLRYREGFSGLLGFTTSEARVMLSMHKGKGLSLRDMSDITDLSESTLRGIVKRLQKKHLMTTNRIKKTKYYMPLKEITPPGIDRNAVFPASQIKVKGKLLEGKIREADIRPAIKAMNPESDISRFDIFYYPVYTVTMQGREERKIRIDAVTGTVV